MTEFFQMGGYGAYIWCSYGFASLCLIVLLIASWRQLRRSTMDAAQLEAVLKSRRPRRSRGAHPASQAE